MKLISQQSTTLKRNPGFQIIVFNLFQIAPTQTTYPPLASLGNFNGGGARFPQDSERPELNMFNLLLILQLMGLLGTKAI